MITVLSVVLAGLFIGWWCAQALVGWKSYVVAVLAALLIVPAVGFLAAYFDGMLPGGSARDLQDTAVGLGLAVALIEVPLIVFKRKRRKA